MALENTFINKPFDAKRRNFLRKAAIGAGLVTAASLTPNLARAAGLADRSLSPTPEASGDNIASPEKAPVISQQLFLDFSPMVETDNTLAQESHMQIVEFKDMEAVIAQMKTEWTRDNPDSDLPPERVDHYLRIMLRQFSDHGRKMIETAAQTAQELSGNELYLQSVRYEIVPLQRMLELVGPYVPSPPFEKGVVGESGYYLRLPPEKIIEALRGTSQTVINFSFQVGTFGLVEKKIEKLTEVVNNAARLSFEKYAASPTKDRYFAKDPSLEQGFAATIYEADHVTHGPTRQMINGVMYEYSTDEAGYTTKIFNPATGEELRTYSEQEMEKLREIDRQKNIVGTKKEIVTQTEHQSAYIGERAEENLRGLCSIAQAYPEKLFFASLGNSGEDITETREKLRADGTWPDNLVIVGESERYRAAGQSTGIRPMRGSGGADMFVTNGVRIGKRQPLGGGSSFSTAFVSSMANHLLTRVAGSLQPAEIIQQLRSLTEVIVDQESGKSFHQLNEEAFWHQTEMRNEALG